MICHFLPAGGPPCPCLDMPSLHNKQYQSTPRLMVSIFLLLLVINVESSLHSGRKVAAVWAFRGGANDDNGNDIVSFDDDADDYSPTRAQQELQPPSFSSPSSLLSLFQWNDQIKFQAQQEQPPLRLRSNHTETEDNVAANRQRGGALVATATKPPPSAAAATTRSRFQSWWAPLVGDRVASRLMQEEGDEQKEDASSNATASADAKEAVNKSSRTTVSSWWISTRTSLSSEQKQQSSDRNMTMVRDKVEKEEEEELSGDEEAEERVDVLKPRSIARGDEKDKENAIEESSFKASSEGAGVAKTLPPTRTVRTVVPINATALPTRRRTWTVSPYESSGYWQSIDSFLTLGYADNHAAWKLSRRLRRVRKLTAKYTGLHGVLSGKTRPPVPATTATTTGLHMNALRRRLAAIDRARKKSLVKDNAPKRRGLFRRSSSTASALREGRGYSFFFKKSHKEEIDEMQRKERVKEIDRLFIEFTQKLQDLACEKDMLQRRPNPLWNYTTISQRQQQRNVEILVNATNTTTATTTPSKSSGPLINATRRFNFPPEDLVDEYLDMLFLSSRLVKLNHTDLWKNAEEDDDEDELMDDFFDSARRKNSGTASAKSGNGNWWLRHGLGEKIGEAAERAAYKSVCTAIMGVLARSIAAIHGANVMKYADIRLTMEQAPNLPPLGYSPGIQSNYAKHAIQEAMRRGAQRNSKKKRHHHRKRWSNDFIQRGAVVETLLSHCQISAPLLRLFPLAWQRALVSNIITLVAAVIADFCEGIEFQILGHRLTFAFTPLTEEDVLRGMTAKSPNRPWSRPEDFEAAVTTTAAELSQELKFLDRWHERALGSGMLRSQIATLIARLVLTLIDDVLAGAKMDLWSTQAGGPRLVAGLEYRTTPSYMGESKFQPQI